MRCGRSCWTACRWRRSGLSWPSLRAGDWSRSCWHCAGSAGAETSDEVAMSNEGPPLDQERGILRILYEVFVIASSIFFGLLVAWELSLAFVNALPRASGLGDIYRLHWWLGAI